MFSQSARTKSLDRQKINQSLDIVSEEFEETHVANFEELAQQAQPQAQFHI